MQSIFSAIRKGSYKAPASWLQTLIQMSRQDKLTTMVEVDDLPYNRLLLFFENGVLVNAYSLDEQACKRIDPDKVVSLLGDHALQVRVLTLPLEGIQIGRLLAEHAGEGESLSIQGLGLPFKLQEWMKESRLSAFEIHWETAEAAIILPGLGSASCLALFISPDEIASGTSALQNMRFWPEQNPVVKRYNLSEPQSEAGQQYQLQRVFVSCLEHIFARYEVVAGHSLMYLLGRNFTGTAEDEHWNIECVGKSILVRHLFPGIQEEFRAYRTLCDFCLAQIEAVVGPLLTGDFVKEALASIDPDVQEVMKTHPLFLPTGSVEGKTL